MDWLCLSHWKETEVCVCGGVDVRWGWICLSYHFSNKTDDFYWIYRERGKSEKRPGELLDRCEVCVSHSVVSDSLWHHGL